MNHLSPTRRLALLVILLVVTTPSVRAQQAESPATPPAADQSSVGDIEFSMEGMEGFGDEDFQVDDNISMEDAAKATKVAIGITAVCTGIPALFLGGVAGYVLGRRKKSQ